MAAPKKRIARLLQDLTTLEVSTIDNTIKTNTTDNINATPHHPYSATTTP